MNKLASYRNHRTIPLPPRKRQRVNISLSVESVASTVSPVASNSIREPVDIRSSSAVAVGQVRDIVGVVGSSLIAQPNGIAKSIEDLFAVQRQLSDQPALASTPASTPSLISASQDDVSDDQRVNLGVDTTSHVINSGNAQCLELTLSDGHTVKCSDSQLILVRDSSKTSFRYCQAKDLHVNETIVSSPQFATDRIGDDE